MIERTLVVIKPDGTYRALIGKVISTMEDAGLKIVGLKMVLPDEEVIGKHYVADEEYLESIGAKNIKSYKEKGVELKESALEIGQRVRGYLLKYLMSGPVVAMVVEGNDAIFVVRKLIGTTEGKKADPSSFRGKHSSDSYELADLKKRAVRNLVHISEDPKNAEREISLWFKKKELLDYKRVDEHILYD